MFLLAIITGVLSAFLDNVTTILLITPLTFSMAKDLELNPVPFVISNVFASNVGGTATLIGDPPNIMIGSSVGIPFMDFITNLSLPIVFILLVTTTLFTLQNKKHLKITDEAKLRVMNISEEGVIKDPVLLKKSLIVLFITIVGFLLSGALGYESSTIAIFMAGVFLLISKQDIPGVLEEVEWPVIFFFSGLFVMVGALVETGIIESFAKFIVNATGDNFTMLAIAILWVSAIASAFIDNIPFVATMIPLIQGIAAVSSLDVEPLWWCLSLGACLGGNGTLIGASANVVAAGMCEERGYKVTFAGYTKKAFPLMMLSVALSTVYVLIRYL
jgi:Na+/H+ antiporter NhaD/arsenite permease-like protein